MKKLYLLSGLGADERVFANLSLPETELIHVPWLPITPELTLEQYAHQLANLIPEASAIHLLGVSFGGIVAQEIARIRPCQRVFVISSIRSQQQKTSPLQLLRHVPLHRWIPASWLKMGGKVVGPFAFGTKGKKEAQFLRQIIADTDPTFLRWAIREIIRWDGGYELPTLRHLHGDQDRLFPLKNMEDATVLTGGTHWMIYQRGEEVSRWIKQEW